MMSWGLGGVTDVCEAIGERYRTIKESACKTINSSRVKTIEYIQRCVVLCTTHRCLCVCVFVRVYVYVCVCVHDIQCV